MSEALVKIRDGIDAIDDEIARLICQRAELAREVRRIKKGGQLSTYAPSREKEIIQRVLPSCLEAGFSREHIEGVFLSVISACRAIVGDIEVCVSGAPASISYAAAVKQFGPLKNIYCAGDSSLVMSRIEQGFSQFGLVPISNSGTGVVNHTLDLLMSHEVTVVAERQISEEYSIYSFETSLDQLSHLYGEGESLDKINRAVLNPSSQISMHLLPEKCTSLEMLRELLRANEKSGILASRGFSPLLEVPCLNEKVPLNDASELRYYVVGKEPCPVGDMHITSLVCAIKDTRGSLRDLLEPFSKLGISLRTLESKKPKGSAWECMFFLEVEGGMHEQNMQDAYREMEKNCNFVKILGSFPQDLKN
jgi:chorismate mutase / prephenate dehydratase